MDKHTITRDTNTWLLILEALNDKADALWDDAMDEGAEWQDGALADESRRFCLIADEIAEEMTHG